MMKQVKVILIQHVAKLGRIGDVVNVKPGYARNFLLPQKMALRANKANLEYFEGKRAEIEAQNAKNMADAEAIAKTMNGLSIVVVRQASEKGMLYGSVSARDIAAEISGKGFSVKPGQVSIHAPIKEIGVHTVQIALHPEVLVDVKISIGKTDEEAAVQLSAS